MRFTSPLFLFLLFLVPLTAWAGWPSPGAARRRGFISLAIRMLIILCLILSLAGLEIIRSGDELAVVFLMDVSDSMSQQAVEAETIYVRSAIESMGPDDRSAIILFGADALVDRPMIPVNELGLISSIPVTNQTDLAEAIRLAMALYPPGAARRMVILSDGAQTSGNARAAAEYAAASGVEIVIVPFINETGAETLITNVDAPTQLRPGEDFELNVSLRSNQATSAVLRVLAGHEILYEETHSLRRGDQTFSLPLTAGQPGFVSYEVQIVPDQDTFYQNNLVDAYSEVLGPPSILMVSLEPGEVLPGGEVRPDEHSALLQALQAAGFNVELVTPNFLPLDLPTLAQYDSVVLVDVPARTLTNRQMQILQSYVRDLGGGLVAVGGPTSYGVGGYYGTPIEDALPVEMQIKDEQRRPSLAMVFIIDHSGSMSDSSGGALKLELAKEAAARSVELLFPTDRVGVVMFDDVASWVVPMTDLSTPDQVTSAIGGIQPGGGTDIMSGLQAMADVLPDDPARVKHVILLTDGGADPTGIPELVEKLFIENGITLSTVGVGNDAAPFLEDLAQIGGGRYHFTADAGSIPSIFTEETSLATRSYIIEESFFPTLVNSSPILAHIDSLPQLHGYVGSSAKDLATVILESDKKDPILAAWQYGLGRSVAFTSDATGRWGRNWVGWEGFPTFWVQTVRYTIGETRDTSLEMSVQNEGEQTYLILNAQEPNGSFLNDYDVSASIVAPNGEAQNILLHQTAPGRYEAQFSPAEQGVYLIRLSGEGGLDGRAFSETMGWALSYSPEYLRIESDPDLLMRLVALTSGKVASANPADVFTHDLEGSRASRPIWPWLLLIAILLFPLDIAIRRLMLTRQDLDRTRAWLAARFNIQQTESHTPQADARMQNLLKVKERVRENRAPVSDPLKNESLPDIQQTPDPQTPGTEVQAAPAAESTTASLLAKKKERRK
jgi:Ca-activated chloride channel family protein